MTYPTQEIELLGNQSLRLSITKLSIYFDYFNNKSVICA